MLAICTSSAVRMASSAAETAIMIATSASCGERGVSVGHGALLRCGQVY